MNSKAAENEEDDREDENRSPAHARNDDNRVDRDPARIVHCSMETKV